MQLSCGYNATYFFVNKQMDFITPKQDRTDSDEVYDGMEETIQRVYTVDDWSLVDQGPGGFAVVKNDKPRDAVRVGDLVGVSKKSAKESSQKWDLGVIRWLMIRQNKIHKVGIQVIGKNTHTAAIRAAQGNPQDLHYRRAFLIGDTNDLSSATFIATKGMFSPDRELEIHRDEQTLRVLTHTLQESTVSFDHFSVQEKTI